MRPLRRSPLYDRLAAKGAVFGSKMNWERANYFLPAGAARAPYTLGTPDWLPYVMEEQRACREDVVVFDQTSFGKFVLKGRDALALLQRLCANDIDVPVGRMVYTAMLNARGGFESDLTVIRLAPSRVLHHHRLGADDARCRVDRTPHRGRRARGARRRDRRLLGHLGDGAEVGTAAWQTLVRRLVESGNAICDDQGNRRRSCAGSRGENELRRRSGLRALRQRRPVSYACMTH